MQRLVSIVVLGLVVGIVVAVVPPARADDALAQSYTLEARKDYAGAAKLVSAAAAASPRDYFLALRLGYLDALAGDHANAAAAYDSAATLQPAAVEPLLGEQLALANAGRWGDAIAVGRKVIALDALSYLGRSRLAWALYKHKDYGDAAATYRGVLTQYPGDVDMKLGLGWALLGAGHKDGAAQAFREVLAMVPKHASATEGLAAATK